jgi:hypothetical protein
MKGASDEEKSRSKKDVVDHEELDIEVESLGEDRI